VGGWFVIGGQKVRAVARDLWGFGGVWDALGPEERIRELRLFQERLAILERRERKRMVRR
jgi:hypothetical protein